MLLAELVSTSNQVARTSSRNSKVSLIADTLRKAAVEVADGRAPAEEIGLATRYLSGALRQRRTGIELSWGSGGPGDRRPRRHRRRSGHRGPTCHRRPMPVW